MSEKDVYVPDFDREYVIEALTETREDLEKKLKYYDDKRTSIIDKIQNISDNIDKLKAHKQKKL